MDSSTQQNLFESGSQTTGPVECLGLTFENDDARREHFLAILREKLKDPEFRKIEGFPIGEDEDILALSDPPYYTACPNPFLEDFIRCYGKPYDPETDDYHREPFAADVSEGKNDPIYNAHSYHTKVPHKAIMRYILHYTEPGDIVFDGFCGTGMTGVAAQLCGDRAVIESLGYKIEKSKKISDGHGNFFSSLGRRKALLNDLSPAASFISYNYNTPFDSEKFRHAAQKIIGKFEESYGWMYETLHSDLKTLGRINYVVWSDIFQCNFCQGEINFWYDAVLDGEIKDKVVCPHCSAALDKRQLSRVTTTVFDESRNKPIVKAKRIPVYINYSVGNTKFEKELDNKDLQVLERIESEPIPEWYPTERIDRDIDLWYERDYRSLGVFSVDDFFSRRSLIMLSFFKKECMSLDGRERTICWFWIQSVLMGFSLLNRYLKNAFSQVNRILSGTLYIGSMQSEVSPWYSLSGKLNRLAKLNYLSEFAACVSSSTTSRLPIPDSSIDYIFTDPPFGSNIIYSDLSLLWEAWISVKTNTESEAVIHRRKKENPSRIDDYTKMMSLCFSEMARILKPGRWITVEFHNSKNSVWNSIQESILQAGFVIADVRVLDKQLQTFKQVNAAGAVKQDLVISAYKTSVEFDKKFELEAGKADAAWEFVENHLQQLPVFVAVNSQAETIVERQNYMLFDRMVAFHIQRGITVPLSASEFYAGLDQRFPHRDGMYFLPEQIAEYDRKRMTVKEVLQLDLFVNDEFTAVQWLRQQLIKKPQTFQELHPQFLKVIGGWAKHEKNLELSDLLEENYLRYDGGTIPKQIVSWLAKSSTYRAKLVEIIGINSSDTNSNLLAGVSDSGLETHDTSLVVAAKDRWYMPDPRKEADLEKLRDRALLREFEEYRKAKNKLKVFRIEAMRSGFKRLWQDKDYKTIISISQKIPETVLQEDPKLLMYYDQSVTRAGDI
ncbi:MAG: DNA methylase [Leptolyngbya sp.]|nr:MAG: DNA methylase [Leptolyngbya sp.]